MKGAKILTIALICLLPVSSGADEILLKNGSRMTGTITAVDKQQVRIRTGYGMLNVPRTDIRSAVIGELPPRLSGGGAATSAAPAGDASSADAPSLSDGLVAAYDLDSSPRDSSGNGLNGSIKGHPMRTLDRFGKGRSAFSFKGRAGDLIEIPDRPELHLKHFTLSAWVTGANPRLWARILQKYNYNGRKGYALFYNHKERTIAFDAWGTDGKNLGIQTRHKLLKKWQQVCVTYDGTILRIYYNGKMEAERKVSRTLRHTTVPLTIGGGNDGNNDFPWSGKIDGVRIYNRALSAAQVAGLYRETGERQAVIDLTQKKSF